MPGPIGFRCRGPSLQRRDHSSGLPSRALNLGGANARFLGCLSPLVAVMGEHGRSQHRLTTFSLPAVEVWRAGQPFSSAPAGGWTRAAFRNSRDDMSHRAAKNPFRIKMSNGQIGPVEPNPAISAIAATNA